MAFFNWLDILKDVEAGPTLPAGMSRRATILGENMLALHEAFPNLKCRPHTHESSQISYVLSGKLRMRIGDTERVLVPGEFAYVPSKSNIASSRLMSTCSFWTSSTRSAPISPSVCKPWLSSTMRAYPEHNGSGARLSRRGQKEVPSAATHR